MSITYVLKCGDCPHYYPGLPEVNCGWNGGPGTPAQCTHPDTLSGIASPFLNGPSVMPPQCPLIESHTTYRAVRREMPK